MFSKTNVILVVASILAVSILFIPSVSVFGRPNLRLDNTNWASTNWAGYADYSGTYTSATGSWQVPALSTSTTGYSSVWVGVGGFSGSTVIQIGTEQDCLSGKPTAGEMRYHGLDDSVPVLVDSALVDSNFNNGKGSGGSKTSSCNPTYYAWWEMYPANAEVKISGFTVKPGDQIQTSVQQVSGGWTLTINDITTGKSFSTTQNLLSTPDQGSKELIVERPALCTRFSCTLTNLANFGKVTFGSSSVDFTNPITMVNNHGQILAQPFATSSVQWVRSS